MATTSKKKYLLLIPLIGIAALLFYRNTFIEFEPIIFDDNSYKEINVDGLFYKNLEKVLDYNNIRYKINGEGKVLIKRYLSADKDLLLNYTKKALDTVW